MRFTVIAASALALMLATSVASASPAPTKLWYKLKIVYLASHSAETIRSDGGKHKLTMKSAFNGASDTAVLVRKAPGGRLAIRGSTFGGRLTSFEWDYTQDWFVGTVAPCKEHTHESLVGSAVVDGVVGAEPGFRRGITGFGVSVVTNARTTVERFAVAPCAGSIRNRPIQLLNESAVQMGEPPQFLVKGSVDPDRETSPVAMLRIPSDKRKTPEERTVGKFGKQTFSILSHLVVSYGPKYIGGVIDSYKVDEAWFFSFTRCPGTAPC